MVVGRYRALFAAFGIQGQGILIRLTNWRLYIGPYGRSYLAGLDGDWEERLTRWTLAVQTALEEGVELPFFPVEIAHHPPRGTRTVPESGPLIRGQSDQERAASGAAEDRQNAGIRYTTPVGQPGTPKQGPRPRQTYPGQQCPHPATGGRVGIKGQTRPGENIWEGVTSSQRREKGRHEYGTTLQASG